MLAELDASKLKITTKEIPAEYAQGKFPPIGTLSDHMIIVDHDSETGWHAPVIVPTEDFKIDPAASVLHYAIECFEGMKAYKGKDKKVRLFRPKENMARLNNSGARILLPSFDGDEFIKIMDKWLEIDADFVPEGGMVYVRPNYIGYSNCFGLAGPRKARLYCFAAQSSYALDYEGDFKPLKLYSNDSATHVRLWPGGFGNTKLGANYGPTAILEVECLKNGCDQTLWLYGKENIVTEAGGSNFFVVWINDEGKKEAVTASLDLGMILPGITRKSIIELLKSDEELIVTERAFTIDELIKKSKEGKLLEAFACGTYYFVSPVGLIQSPDGEKLDIPTPIDGKWGPISKDLYTKLKDIMWGNVENDWSHIC